MFVEETHSTKVPVSNQITVFATFYYQYTRLSEILYYHKRLVPLITMNYKITLPRYSTMHHSPAHTQGELTITLLLWSNHHGIYVTPTCYPRRRTIPYMYLVGLIIVSLLHIPLYPISNGLRELQQISTIAICNINHTSHQMQLPAPLLIVKKAPKKLFLPGVKEQLC